MKKLIVLMFLAACGSVTGSGEPDCEKETGVIYYQGNSTMVTNCYRLDNGQDIDCDMCRVVRAN